jgi:hypothetical protein
MRMMTMMIMRMTNFYSGTSTNCTAAQIVTRNKDDDDDDDNNNTKPRRWHASNSGNNNNTNNNTDAKAAHQRGNDEEEEDDDMPPLDDDMPDQDDKPDEDDKPDNDKPDNDKKEPLDDDDKPLDRDNDRTLGWHAWTDPAYGINRAMESTDGANQPRPMEEPTEDGINRWNPSKESTNGTFRRHQPTESTDGINRRNQQKHEDAATTLQWTNPGRMPVMWMTDAETMIPSATGTLDRKTSQASPRTKCLYNNQATTTDKRNLADDTVVDGNRWNQQMESKMNRTIAEMDDNHNLT